MALDISDNIAYHTNMNKVTLPITLVNRMWNHWCFVRENMFDIKLVDYYQSRGWNLDYDYEKQSYTLPENQLAFFLLAYES